MRKRQLSRNRFQGGREQEAGRQGHWGARFAEFRQDHAALVQDADQAAGHGHNIRRLDHRVQLLPHSLLATASRHGHALEAGVALRCPQQLLKLERSRSRSQSTRAGPFDQKAAATRPAREESDGGKFQGVGAAAGGAPLVAQLQDGTVAPPSRRLPSQWSRLLDSGVLL